MCDCIPSETFGLRRLAQVLLVLALGASQVTASELPNLFEPFTGHGDCATDATGEVVCSSCDPGWGGETCQDCLDPRLCGPGGYGEAAITRYHPETPRQWAAGIFPGTAAVRSFQSLDPVDVETLLEEDLRQGWRNRWGVILDAGLHSDRNGRWVDQANGGRVWTAAIESQGASTLSVLFGQLDLVPGAELWVVSERAVYGPLTDRHLRGGDGASTAPLWGERVVIELYDPPSGGSSVGSVHLSHGYRDLGATQNDCQVDVACYRGAENVANSVAMILKHGTFNSFGCTGAMINNYEAQPYLLTAEHCLFEYPQDYFAYLKNPDQDPSSDFFFNLSPHAAAFVFQYRNQSCDSHTYDPSIFEALTYHGDVTVIHHDHETDTALVSLEAWPSPQCVTYAGYDAEGAVPSYTAGISHPDGKLAKLSIDWDPPGILDMADEDPEIDANYVEEDTVWKVELEVGYLEGGSSGSPLFDPTARIIGPLSGHIQNEPGFCDQSVDFVYGRLARAYELSNDLSEALVLVTKMGSAGSTVSDPVPLQKFGPFDACVGMTNKYGVNPKVAEHFAIEWEVLSDHGTIVGPGDERTVQVHLGWQATEAKLRVTVRSTDPSRPYERWETVTYDAYGCEDGP